MKISRKTSVTASIVLAAGLVLTGCSSPNTAAEGGKESSQEATTNSAALTKENFAERISKAQLKAGSVHISMDLGDSAPGTIEADMSINEDPKKVQMQMIMDTDGMEADIRVVDGKMFMSMGQLTGGKFMDISEMPGGAGDISAMLDQVNPSAQLNGFGTALTDFQADPEGPEIDGVKTTHVTLTLDTKKLFEAQPQEGMDVNQLVETLGETMVYDMFVGADDLVRRIAMPNVGGVGTMTQEFSAWGEPVSIEAPGADEITDLSAMGG